MQENAATAEEMAAGAEILNVQAEQLKEAISFFKIEGKESTFLPRKAKLTTEHPSTKKSDKPLSNKSGVSFNLKMYDNLDQDFISF